MSEISSIFRRIFLHLFYGWCIGQGLIDDSSQQNRFTTTNVLIETSDYDDRPIAITSSAVMMIFAEESFARSASDSELKPAKTKLGRSTKSFRCRLPVYGTDASTSQHGISSVGAVGHVETDAVTLLHSQGLENVGQTTRLKAHEKILIWNKMQEMEVVFFTSSYAFL